MGDIKLNLDISSLSQYLDDYAENIVKDINAGIQGLAESTYIHIKERAQNRLHSSREEYLKSLSPPQKENGVWIITLEADANWIEEGRPEPYDMKPGLLNTTRPGAKSGPKQGKNGKYRIIAMNQAKTPTQMSPETAGYEQGMVNKVKAELKKRGIPYKKLEIDPVTGSPKTGRLHALDIDSYIPGKGNTPQLHGINIYQTKQKDGSTKRTITTFRTVTEHGQEGKWIHPPVDAMDFFGDGAIFAEHEWEQKFLPAIMEKYKGKS